MNIDWTGTVAAVWRRRREALRCVRHVDPITLDELLGIDGQKARLVENTRCFLAGLPANNTLLWGARGTGKSSLVKAVFNAFTESGLRLIEVDRDDLVDLPEIVDEIRDLPQRFIIFCDDLSFAENENSFKHLKSVLEGSIEQPPSNVLIYATSNRRHLMPEAMKDNLDTRIVDGELHYTDAVEEKISLSDRFGLWLSFHPMTMEQYLAIVDRLFAGYRIERDTLHAEARSFAQARASKSGRTARQFHNYFSPRITS
jgi:predicted AAA+ superfamily ATPase